MILYWITHLAVWPFLAIAYRFKVRGLANVPAGGGVILAANHASFLDPPLLGAAVCHRPIRIMARDDLFCIPVIGRLMRKVGALPIRRGGGNRQALKGFASLARDSGEVLLMFPEGTRSSDGALGVPRRGIGAICLASRVPVVPALISGTFDAWPRSRLLPRPWGRVEVRFGAPVQWNDEELNATGDPNGALATLIMKRIAELRMTQDTPVGFWEGYKRILRQPSIGGKPVVERVSDAHGGVARVRSG